MPIKTIGHPNSRDRIPKHDFLPSGSTKREKSCLRPNRSLFQTKDPVVNDYDWLFWETFSKILLTKVYLRFFNILDFAVRRSGGPSSDLSLSLIVLSFSQMKRLSNPGERDLDGSTYHFYFHMWYGLWCDYFVHCSLEIRSCN
jgi:hypothetical protein